jgi:hypothetical protein
VWWWVACASQRLGGVSLQGENALGCYNFGGSCNDKPLTYIIDFSSIYFAIFIFIDKEIVT